MRFIGYWGGPAYHGRRNRGKPMLTRLNAMLFGALGLATLAGIDAVDEVGAPWLSQRQFADNCLAAHGRFAPRPGAVLCTLPHRVELVCQSDGRVGNCLWAGPIDRGMLATLFEGGRFARPRPGTADFAL